MTPGYHYDRYSAIEFMPADTAASYSSVPGGIRHNAPGASSTICPLEQTTVRAQGAGVLHRDRHGRGGGCPLPAYFRRCRCLVATAGRRIPAFQTVTVPIDHVVDIIDVDYEL